MKWFIQLLMSLCCITAHISNILLSISQISYFVNYEELVLVLLALLRQVQPGVLVLLHPAVAHRHSSVLKVLMFQPEETTETVCQHGDHQPG